MSYDLANFGDSFKT